MDRSDRLDRMKVDRYCKKKWTEVDRVDEVDWMDKVDRNRQGGSGLTDGQSEQSS